jgi:N6-adenosine-specific RNA methylase IME4
MTWPLMQLGYIDPPWNFKTYSKKGLGKSPEKHYPTLTVADMARLSFGDLFAPDSSLAMWATYPVLDQAIELGKAWGYAYKTVLFTWAKLNKRAANRWTCAEDDVNWFMGTGFHTRANPEIVLLFSRGKGLKRRDSSVRNLIVAPVARHSKKPDLVYRQLERLYGDVNRVEIFARQRWDGWWSIGNEISGLDIRVELPRILAERSA